MPKYSTKPPTPDKENITNAIMNARAICTPWQMSHMSKTTMTKLRAPVMRAIFTRLGSTQNSIATCNHPQTRSAVKAHFGLSSFTTATTLPSMIAKSPQYIMRRSIFRNSVVTEAWYKNEAHPHTRQIAQLRWQTTKLLPPVLTVSASIKSPTKAKAKLLQALLGALMTLSTLRASHSLYRQISASSRPMSLINWLQMGEE
mmetsp:Transcript_15115/g.26793  ORF Transcript_15115/g.26793 Transcript_15115/m.26793 type:complete len:201 (+) Transcript_15115:164-766(+)